MQLEALISQRGRGLRGFGVKGVNISEILFVCHFVFGTAVVFEIVFGRTCKWTDCACKRLFAGVDSQVSFQLVRIGKAFAAKVAFIDAGPFSSWLIGERRNGILYENKWQR